ncbi:MAG: aspartyl protease family protein [Tolypothrix carrinoi HA7290-LM1]|nr:aspartyl protease family protein [Tolypothrix carrinoi HA7290-LM1]
MMGAVHAKVKLTNAVDEELVNRGLLAPTLLREHETQGLVDTGAVSLVIPTEIVEQLGLRIRGQRLAQYANGSEEIVGVTGPVIVECQGRETVAEALVVGNEVLIGLVVLEQLDLLVDCKNQRLIPNPANPDYPVAMIKCLGDVSATSRGSVYASQYTSISLLIYQKTTIYFKI